MKPETLKEAVEHIAVAVKDWKYAPWTDNDGNDGYRYVSRDRTVAFVTEEFVRVGEVDGIVLFTFDISNKDDMYHALVMGARSADSLSNTYEEIENKIQKLYTTMQKCIWNSTFGYSSC